MIENNTVSQLVEDIDLTRTEFNEKQFDNKIVDYTPNPKVNYNPKRDAAAQQLLSYKLCDENQRERQITTLKGAPIGDDTNILTVGPRGPQLMEDGWYQEEMAHFDRERIPERIVHAKGAGAFGYFEVTNDEITKYCQADLFSSVGKRTPVAVRFSTVAGESGTADTVRDPRGFSVKFYTNEGNWDLVGNNTPVFFVRDPFMFISFIHSQKRNNQTYLRDYNARWDFFTLRHESLYQVTFMFGDRGIPDGFTHMDGWSSSAYKLVNKKNESIYNQFIWRTNQGVRGLDLQTANSLTGNPKTSTDPDYGIHNLYDAIACKAYPSWTLYIQIMTCKQAEEWEYNPFDITKVWPESEFPPIEVGRMVLNRNPTNYFAEVEQLSFDPSDRVPGVEFSPDKMLQGRLFAYTDTARHRLGSNYHLIPVNAPLKNAVNLRSRDGPMMTGDNMKNAPSYYPNSFANVVENRMYNEVREPIKSTDIYRFESKSEDNYTQVRELYLSYSEDEKQRLYTNIAAELSRTYDFIQNRAYDMFCRVHTNYGEGVRKAVEATKYG